MQMSLLRGAFALATLVLSTVAGAKNPGDYKVEDFFRLAEFTNVSLSPDGNRLAAMAPLKGRNNLVVIDLAKRTPQVITNFTSLDVATFSWINNERLCLVVADGQEASGQFTYKGTYCVDHDGGNLRNFSQIRDRPIPIRLLALPLDGSPDAIVAMRERSRDTEDVYRFNTRTGRYQLLSEDSPGFVDTWIVDRDNVPRVAVSQPERKRGNPNNLRTVWYRDGAGAKWEKLFEFPMVGTWSLEAEYIPLAFDYDNTTLYLAHNAGRDKFAIYKYDTKARKMGELVLEDPLVDIESRPVYPSRLVFSRTQKKLLGIQYEADRPKVKWLDPDMERLQKSLDATFPTTANQITLPALNEKRALVFAESDRDPGMYHLLDRAKPSLEPLVRQREWIKPEDMAERKFITYKARDGMDINAWVTMPNGSSGKNLPLIVNIHGGPWLRVYEYAQWGRWPEAQFFASRGYVVLEPEPRGSTGFGRKLFKAGLKQFGQAMQDDITDGALHLVKEGVVDKNRMCLHGGSYGGYATAMGLAKDPDLWKCGSPFIAVTDLATWQKAQYSDLAALTDFLDVDYQTLVGDSSKDREMFTKFSPVEQAGRIKAPILLTMGADDVRVPLVHGEDFRSALQKNGKKVEYVVYREEGHGYNKPENVYDFYRRLEKFFAENLKP